MHLIMEMILIIIFILIISTIYKKAQKKGLRTYHIVVPFLIFPLAVFLDYCLQRQAILLDLAALKTTAIYGFPMAFIFSLFLYTTSRKKEFK
jgi:cbb3-type cytochrome oxidase subunit 3